SDAVIRGIEDHGEEFELSVQHSPDGRGAGSEVDASDPKYTDWYKEEAENNSMRLVTGGETEPTKTDSTKSEDRDTE
ncbi:MAG: BCCT family transporter, partial [Yaniella sp.]|nr:BCCT family transporter [Yaniella sp.]